MSDARAEKLNAARRKLKEFQEQKKLRERNSASTSPALNNENLASSSVPQDDSHRNFPVNNEKTTSTLQQNINSNTNTIQYFMPNTQQALNESFNQGYYSTSLNSNQHNNTYSEVTNPSTIDIKAYFSDNIYQPHHDSLDNPSSTNNETYSDYDTGKNNTLPQDNESSIHEKVTNNNQFTFPQNSNGVNNVLQVDQETNNDNNSNNLISNENFLGVGENGNTIGVKETGNTNFNILSVFSNSSNTSSHGSSTHTGPFLLNEEIPQQQNNENVQTPCDINRNSQQPEDIQQSHTNGNAVSFNDNAASFNDNTVISDGNSASLNGNATISDCNNPANYHLFEQTHNENYFGINFGNEGPGLHMNVNPFEHRSEKQVHDFLDSETSNDNDQPTVQEKTLHSSSDDPGSEILDQQTPSHSVLDQQTPSQSDNVPINLLNDTFRRNLLSLSTSKSTSVEEYTDKSTRGNSTVSKSVSLESSGGGGVGGGGVYFDDLLMKDSTNSSTVFSSCDNITKLLSSAAESSSEPPCTNSHCEEACLLEMEKRNEQLRAMLSNEQQRTDQLETQVTQLKTELLSFQSSLSDRDKQLTSVHQEYQQQVKSQTHTIQILIEEKRQLESRLNSTGDIVEGKNKEIEELKGRLAISKHKSANIERDAGLLQEQLKQNSKQLQDVNDVLAQERKQLEDLAEDKVALTHKLDTKCQELYQYQTLLQERDSQMSLLQLKLQQLNAAGGLQSVGDNMNDILVLQQERDQLRNNVTELSEHVKILTRERDKTLQYHVQIIESLKAKNEELSNLYGSMQAERSSLAVQCENQILHIGDLEKQLQSLREHQSQDRTSASDQSALKPLVAEMEKKIKNLSWEKQRAETMLQAQVLETEMSRERMEQLTREIEKLESDRPDASALLSAMESDKIAASRAVQQNGMLKQQLQDLQDALIAMNNTKLELTEQLGQEQLKSKELSDIVTKLQQEQQLQQEHTNEPSSDITTQTIAPLGDINPHSTGVDQNALRALEEKFKLTMTELAEISDEKQRLEHLVTQLQLETETIGEYAALYQKQRYLLQQKSREKDEQVKQLSKDQEALKEKLAKLNALVQDFVHNRSEEGVDALRELTGETGDVPTPALPVADSKATQIMALISEIESNSLVEGGVPSSFHPCLVCSGQLITV